MTDEERHELKQRCRIALLDDAERRAFAMSRKTWEQRANASEAGGIVGPREVAAIGALVFGPR